MPTAEEVLFTEFIRVNQTPPIPLPREAVGL